MAWERQAGPLRTVKKGGPAELWGLGSASSSPRPAASHPRSMPRATTASPGAARCVGMPWSASKLLLFGATANEVEP
ncbi:hypothetical protein AXG93_4448s1240 [Marchantia polymorpha subsp. ruderalis]|uniref:Uncharacterized protein n=1 Tax=Marchantia polymorpha subsp. ruderalis TaxID=1480154 RepID=A0A176VCQ8_MARPO|nr:hypothetical protein AXG93_4448s1240 [Marchantia polymorpha subsp. ruderalis]